MDLETAEKVAKWVVKASFGRNWSVNFFCGEPLLNTPALERIIELTGSKRGLYSITTNATLIDERLVDLFEEYGFGITLSIDGDKDTQNAHRIRQDGESSYEAALRGLKLILRSNIPSENICISSVFTRDTYRRIYDNLKFLVDAFLDAGRSRARVQTVIDKKENKFLVDEPDLLPILLNATERIADEYISKGLFFYPLWLHGEIYAVASLIDEYEIIAQPSDFWMCNYPAKHMIFISPKGDIYPCFDLYKVNDVYLGSIEDEPSLIFKRLGTLYSQYDHKEVGKGRYSCFDHCNFKKLCLSLLKNERACIKYLRRNKRVENSNRCIHPPTFYTAAKILQNVKQAGHLTSYLDGLIGKGGEKQDEIRRSN
jgi:uncharacterized protein